MPIKSNQLAAEVKVADAIATPTPGAGQGIFYPKDVGAGVIEGFYKNSTTSEVQLTAGGQPVGQNNTASNSGSGTGTGGIFKVKTGSDLVFKKILAGAGITVNNLADDIQIVCNVVAGETNTASSVPAASGIPVFKTKTGVDFVFKKIKAGTNIDVTEPVDGEVTISLSNLAQNVYTGSNVGTGEGSVFKEISSNDFKFKRIKQGANVTVSETATDITISSTGGGGGGETNTASNAAAGTGLGLFKIKTGVDLVFKKIKAGTGIALTSFDDDVEINLSGGTGEANTSSNATAGTGAGLVFKQKSGVDLIFRKLLAGSGVSISTGTDDITISASGTGEINTGSNLGTGGDGEGVFDSKLALDLRFKRIKAGSANITVTPLTNSVVIDSVADVNAGSNVGTGEGSVFKDKNANALRFKTIKAGAGVTVTNNTDDVTIVATGSGTTLYRYQAHATANEEIEVLATGLGVTYSRSGTTGTLAVPGSVRLISAKLRLPMAVIGGTSFTVAYGTNGGADLNTSFTDFFPPTQQVWREDSMAQVASSSNFSGGKDRITLTGLASSQANIAKLVW